MSGWIYAALGAGVAMLGATGWLLRPNRVLPMDRLLRRTPFKTFACDPVRTPLLNAAIRRGWTTNAEFDRILLEQLAALDGELQRRGHAPDAPESLEA